MEDQILLGLARPRFVCTSYLYIDYLCSDLSSPSTKILEGPDIYFSGGGLVNLTCVVRSAIQPGRIFWYHKVWYPSPELGRSTGSSQFREKAVDYQRYLVTSKPHILNFNIITRG